MKCKTHFNGWGFEIFYEFSSRFPLFSSRNREKKKFNSKYKTALASTQVVEYIPFSLTKFQVLSIEKLFSRHHYMKFSTEMKPIFFFSDILFAHSRDSNHWPKWNECLWEKEKEKEKEQQSFVQNGTFHAIIEPKVCTLSKVKFMNEFLLLVSFLPLSNSTIFTLNQPKTWAHRLFQCSIWFTFHFVLFLPFYFFSFCYRATLVLVCMRTNKLGAPLVKGNEWHSN